MQNEGIFAIFWRKSVTALELLPQLPLHNLTAYVTFCDTGGPRFNRRKLKIFVIVKSNGVLCAMRVFLHEKLKEFHFEQCVTFQFFRNNLPEHLWIQLTTAKECHAHKLEWLSLTGTFWYTHHSGNLENILTNRGGFTLAIGDKFHFLISVNTVWTGLKEGSHQPLP